MSGVLLTQPIESMHLEESTTKRNTLSKRLAVDALTAFISTICVSPVMVVIDRAVVERAAGTSTTIATSIRHTVRSLAHHPLQFLASRPLRAMLMLYSATYMTANICDTLSSERDELPVTTTTTSSTTKFCSVTAVNLVLSLYKDASFARTFGTKSTKTFPVVTYAPLLVRDGITLFASFSLPAILAPNLSDRIERHVSRISVAQLLAPAASQFLATPLHVLGLDLYERKAGLRERMRMIRKTWISISMMRALRVVPAYGVGGVLNNDLRAYLMRKL